MIRRIVLAVLFALSAAVCASAQPGTARREDRNTAIVRAWYEDVLGRGDLERAPALMTDGYVEHGAEMGTGLEGFRAWARTRDLARNPLKLEILHTIAQGDLVGVFLRSNFPGEGEVGYMDLYRLTADGKLAEHWGFKQKSPRPETLLHTNGFITVPRPTDRSKIGKEEERNREGALGWFYDVLAVGDVEHSSAVQQTDYIQHAEGVATGNAGFRDFARRLDLPHHPFKVTILKTVAEGDYILTIGVGDIGGRRMAMPDWIRMREGKLQEHWGIVQPVPPDNALPHHNGFLGGLTPVR